MSQNEDKYHFNFEYYYKLITKICPNHKVSPEEFYEIAKDWISKDLYDYFYDHICFDFFSGISREHDFCVLSYNSYLTKFSDADGVEISFKAHNDDSYIDVLMYHFTYDNLIFKVIIRDVKNNKTYEIMTPMPKKGKRKSEGTYFYVMDENDEMIKEIELNRYPNEEVKKDLSCNIIKSYLEYGISGFKNFSDKFISRTTFNKASKVLKRNNLFFNNKK